MTPKLKQDAEQRALSEGFVQHTKKGKRAALNDWLNNVVAKELYGVQTPLSSPPPSVSPVVEAPQEVHGGLLAESIDLALAKVDAWDLLDPLLKEASTKEDFYSHPKAKTLQTLDDLEAIEDEVIEIVYQRQKEATKESGLIYKNDGYSGRRLLGVNQALIAESVAALKQKKAKEDKERAQFRAKRRAQLIALLSPALLRQPGDPRKQRQYEEPSAWRSDPDGISARSYHEAKEACKPDSS